MKVKIIYSVQKEKEIEIDDKFLFAKQKDVNDFSDEEWELYHKLYTIGEEESMKDENCDYFEGMYDLEGNLIIS